MPPAPRSNARRPEVSRQIPSDTLLQSSESALASNDLDGLRASAFRLAPTPTAASQLHRMWIPCPTVIKRRHICEMLDELAKDDQPEIWKDARQNKLLQDFKLIPNAGVRFTCSAYATAVKLSLLKLNAFGQQIQIARFSQFASRYYVDLVRLPDEVTDRMIFDWFATRGSPPTCVCPTYMRNGLPSRERTVYFNQDRPPAVLVPSEDEPLREISFSAPDDGMTELRPCFVNHKVARYNRVTPPSILARQAEEETNNSAQAPPSETAKEGPPTGFSSSLKESIRSTQQPKDGDDSSKKSSESLSDGEKDDIPPSMDDDGSESSETSVKSLETFMAETIPTPSCPPDAALWAKTASNRRALLDVSGPDTVQWSKTTYAFDQDQGLAEATDLIKPNYYAPLWFEDPDAENPKWHFDLEVKQTDQDEANLESTPVHQNGPSYLTTVKPATLTYDVESMTRAELFVFINDFLARFETFSALDQLAAIEANPGLMLGTIETKKSLDRLAANRGFLRVLARSPPGNKISLPERLLKLGKDPSELTTQLVTQAQLNESNEVQTLLTLAAWDIALHIMAPTVYQDPLKLLVLTGENPRFLTNLTIPLLTDRVLWKLSFSSLATELHEYSTTPDFIKALIEAVQAIKPPSDDNSIELLSRYQVVALQETKLSRLDSLEKNDYFIKAADSQACAFWSQGAHGSFSPRNGVALLFSGAHPFQDLQDVTSTVTENPILSNRYMVISATLGSQQLFFHVVYGPNDALARAGFFEALPRDFDDSAVHVVLGDFNTTMDPDLDQVDPSARHHDYGRAELFDWMISLGLLDFWRLENPDTREFTGPGLKNRIDYCLASVDFFDKHIRSSSHCFGIKFAHADHIPVTFAASADPEEFTRNKMPFKCPTWLLRSPDVQEQLEDNLDRLLECLDPSRNPGCILDEHKRSDRILLSQEYIRRKNATATQLRVLFRDFQAWQMKHAQDPSDETGRKLQEARQAHLDFQTAIKERNAVSKFDLDVSNAETSSRHFFRAPAATELKLKINSVDTPMGLSRDPSIIQATHRQYWGHLFQSDSNDLHVEPRGFDESKLHAILQHSDRRLNTIQATTLDAPITANDFYYAIKTTARGKSPGPDGLPAEYYQLFPSKWAQVLELVYAAQFRKGRMSKFQRRAYISLLFKKGSRSDPKNYRPLTLLNQDAKFGPKALAYRLNQVLPQLLNEDQYGFVPGRNIRHALRYFLDIQDHCKAKNTRDPAGAICLDFAKAFDSVNWKALDLVLKHWGFGTGFRHWVSTFFTGTLVQVMINDSPSDYFSLGAGVRQGDPLSPGLFVLFIEPLLCYLRLVNSDFAIRIGETRHHLLSFADDVTGLVNNLHQAPAFLDRVQDFCQATGMKLNVDKTVIMPFRPWQDSDAQLQAELNECGVRVLQNADSTRLLGILVGPQCDSSLQLTKLLARFQRLCVIWRWRARTIKGRVLLLKTMILSTLWHFLGVQAVSRSQLRLFDPLVKNFVNNTPSSRVEAPATRSQLPSKWHAPATFAGGLSLPSVETSVELLQVNLIRQLIQHCRNNLASPPKWFIPAQAVIDTALQGQGGGLDFLYIPLSTRATSSRWTGIPQYWLAALAVWSSKILPKLQNENPVLTKLTWPVWNNTFLRFGTQQKTLAVLHHKACNYLSHQGIHRLTDYSFNFGSIPNQANLRVALSGSSISSTSSLTTVVNKLVPRLSVPEHYGYFAVFPLPPAQVIAALHCWHFDGQDIVSLPNSTVLQLLNSSAVPELPLTQLNAESAAFPLQFWKIERSLQRDVLPIFADFVFRLQHNGLGFRYKFGWHTEDTQCVHDCGKIETPRHLLWECYQAQGLWRLFLPPFESIFGTEIGWIQVLFLSGLEVPAKARNLYGFSLPHRLFNIVRCCVLRTLWMNRNKAIYQAPPLQFMGILRQAKTMIRLHYQLLFKALTSPRKKLCVQYKQQLQAFRRLWLVHFSAEPFFLLAED